jgi:hypothetical protein
MAPAALYTHGGISLLDDGGAIPISDSPTAKATFNGQCASSFDLDTAGASTLRRLRYLGTHTLSLVVCHRKGYLSIPYALVVSVVRSVAPHRGAIPLALQ